MAQDRRPSVTLCNTGPIDLLSETQAFATSIGVRLQYIPFQRNPPQPQPRWSFFLAPFALTQTHVALIDVFNKVEPDVVVVDNPRGRLG
jgi:hypothetical protein